MKTDLKESLLIIAKENLGEYENLKKVSGEDFLLRYKLFIDEVEIKREKMNAKQK